MSRLHPTVQSREKAAPAAREVSIDDPVKSFLTSLRDYARQEPEVAACVCLGVGFILGWKLKPW